MKKKRFELWDNETKSKTTVEAVRKGKEWMALCTKHDDHNASLSINEEKGRFNCFGCGFKGSLYDLSKKGHGKRIIKTYDYTDEEGKLIFQVCRYEPKSFKQRRPDGNKGWIWNLDGIQTTLYQLPALMKSEEVIVSEGEKDVDNLISHGFCATTSPMGAKKWRDHYNVFLKGKDVVLVPHNDPEGREHMMQVAISLNGTSKSLKWLELPDLPDKGDISDWLARFEDKEEAKERLAILIENAEPWKPSLEKVISSNTQKFNPITIDELLKILGLTIVRDEMNKLLTFLCLVSAYTEDSQFNISFNAPSSTGKSYIPLETDKLFPQEDVIELGYCSPSAFFHDYGVWDKERKVSIIDLSHKIIIFIDQPHTGLLERLRPILSHDRKEIQSKITDRREKHGLRTKNIVIRGYPSVIFCSAGLKIDEQEATRFLLLSPESDQEKIRESISLKVKKEADPKAFKDLLEENPDRQLLKKRIQAIKAEGIREIRLNNPDKVREMFLEYNRYLKPRHSRDMGRVISIIKALALMNMWFRERDGKTLITDDVDTEEAFKIWNKIFEPQELNLPPYIYDIYTKVILPLWNSKKETTRNEILKKYHSVFKKFLPEWMLRKQIIPMLNQAGLLYEEPDPDDRRKTLIFQTTGEEK